MIGAKLWIFFEEGGYRLKNYPTLRLEQSTICKVDETGLRLEQSTICKVDETGLVGESFNDFSTIVKTKNKPLDTTDAIRASVHAKPLMTSTPTELKSFVFPVVQSKPTIQAVKPAVLPTPLSASTMLIHDDLTGPTIQAAVLPTPLLASTMLIHDDLTIQRRKQHISQTVKHNMTVNTHKHKNICRLCFKSFKHILALRKHQIEDHDNRRPQYTCTYCHKVFISKDSYRGHKSVHRMEIIGRCKNN